jgi:DNA-binding winged helix-turn-helix (wHTH) protein
LYEFGPYRLDPAKRVLLRGDEPVSLTPKAFDTLLLLVQNRDRVIPKEELMNRIWPESFVEEANLSQTVFMLRKSLGETAPEQSYIATVRGSGYRFQQRQLQNGTRHHSAQPRSRRALTSALLLP